LEGEKATRTILEKSDNLEKEKLNIIKTYIEKGGKNTNDLNNGLNYNNNNNNN
jgi:hypothetical protein